VQPKVSRDRTQPLGINVRVARRCCDTLMAKKRPHVAQVGSALVEKERGGRMPQGMSGNNRHPRVIYRGRNAHRDGSETLSSVVAAWFSSSLIARSPRETMPTRRLSRASTARRRIWCFSMTRSASSVS
jgi:hypothetical protein